MAGKGISTGGLAMAVGGGILAWTGLTSPTGNPRDVLTPLLAGKKPGPPSATSAFSGLPGGGPTGIAPGATATGAAIATDAAQYAGHCYTFGGAPGTDGQSCWDCSSFVNWVVGHDFRMAIPGYPAGTYDGSSHGPSSFTWAAWTGCTTVSSNASDAVAGDILIWMNAVGHIGIALGGGQMVSALDPQLGTRQTTITGTASGMFLVRRLNATIPSGTTQAPGTHTAGGRG